MPYGATKNEQQHQQQRNSDKAKLGAHQKFFNLERSTNTHTHECLTIVCRHFTTKTSHRNDDCEMFIRWKR